MTYQLDFDQLDFIGDVHGKGDQLERLLTELGYTQHPGGVWRHPTRLAVFVGDLVDRGTQQLKVIGIVRRMVEAGAALCVLGNHEHNAIGWATEIPGRPGEHFRSHQHFHRVQHEAFLQEVEHRHEEYAQVIGWLKTLPVLLEINGIRIAHACWDERHAAVIQAACNPDGSLTEQGMLDSLTKGTALFEAVEVVTKGPEAILPDGASFLDTTGKERFGVRVAWWRADKTVKGCAMPLPGLSLDALPDGVLDEATLPRINPDFLHFFGHYWMSGEPQVLAPHLASVDYHGSEGPPLTAYRWSGERQLNNAHFVQTY